MRVRTLLGTLLLVGAAVAIVRHRSRPDHLDLWGDRPTRPEPAADQVAVPVAARSGTPAQRGAGGTVRMDLDRARAHRVEPVVEFLTYVQGRRGDHAHLLFVRSADLDAMAEAADEAADDFLARLDRLGVVVSHN